MNLDHLIQIKTNNVKPLKGRVLLSEPFMDDYYFGRSVVLLAEHNPEGSFGVIINKKISTRLSDLLPDFANTDLKVYLGGPVETNRLFYIHTLGNIIQDSIELMDGLYWGGNLDEVTELSVKNMLNDENFRFFLGYSGWGAEQLSTELLRNSWAVTNIDKDQIFKTKSDLLWKKLTLQLGRNYRLWNKFPANPATN
ncbi:MAG: YqgE/AlgH family protein [Bacteroidales bacterium]|nr:YqgE/AlgH family protein [Bacteroidales bacterium]